MTIQEIESRMFDMIGDALSDTDDSRSFTNLIMMKSILDDAVQTTAIKFKVLDSTIEDMQAAFTSYIEDIPKRLHNTGIEI